jgi:hypothetical protein
MFYFSVGGGEFKTCKSVKISKTVYLTIITLSDTQKYYVYEGRFVRKRGRRGKRLQQAEGIWASD